MIKNTWLVSYLLLALVLMFPICSFANEDVNSHSIFLINKYSQLGGALSYTSTQDSDSVDRFLPAQATDQVRVVFDNTTKSDDNKYLLFEDSTNPTDGNAYLKIKFAQTADDSTLIVFPYMDNGNIAFSWDPIAHTITFCQKNDFDNNGHHC